MIVQPWWLVLLCVLIVVMCFIKIDSIRRRMWLDDAMEV